MTAIPFVKYTALGNDYGVINPKDVTFDLTPAWIRRFCDRHWGVGTDGILFGPQVMIANPKNPYGVQIFNPDGSEAEKSGNGLRIFSQYLKDEGLVTAPDFLVQTKGGEVAVHFLPSTSTSLAPSDALANWPPSLDLIQIDMGTPRFIDPNFSDKDGNGNRTERWQVPLRTEDQSWIIHCVSMGNPHCVVVRDAPPSATEIKKYGPLIENHPSFPHKINVQFAWAPNLKTLHLQIWERGAGYTLASGSSACAATVVCHRLGLLSHDVEVIMAGGRLKIQVEKDFTQVRMTGSVQRLYRGLIEL